jgi:hypothetical protein
MVYDIIPIVHSLILRAIYILVKDNLMVLYG